MPENNCPTLSNVLASEECDENLAGLGSVVYVFLKEDLVAPLVATENQYSTPQFKAGKGLYRFDCKDDSQQIEGTSLGRRKGFRQTGTIVLEAVNKLMSKTARALNNLDIGIIFPDGEDAQILYDPNRKVVFDNDGIQSTTGASADDDRQVTLTATLGPTKYLNMYVTPPETGGWEGLRVDNSGNDNHENDGKDGES